VPPQAQAGPARPAPTRPKADCFAFKRFLYWVGFIYLSFSLINSLVTAGGLLKTKLHFKNRKKKAGFLSTFPFFCGIEREPQSSKNIPQSHTAAAKPHRKKQRRA